MTILWIGLGGFLGVNARYFIGRAMIDRFGVEFPWGTLVANLTGAFLIGIVAESLASLMIENETYRLLLIVGFLGGYTTFSSFAFESISLMEDDRWLRAGAYILGSTTLGIIACFIGMTIGRRLA